MLATAIAALTAHLANRCVYVSCHAPLLVNMTLPGGDDAWEPVFDALDECMGTIKRSVVDMLASKVFFSVLKEVLRGWHWVLLSSGHGRCLDFQLPEALLEEFLADKDSVVEYFVMKDEDTGICQGLPERMAARGAKDTSNILNYLTLETADLKVVKNVLQAGPHSSSGTVTLVDQALKLRRSKPGPN
jgi:hypothetical protein